MMVMLLGNHRLVSSEGLILHGVDDAAGNAGDDAQGQDNDEPEPDCTVKRFSNTDSIFQVIVNIAIITGGLIGAFHTSAGAFEAIIDLEEISIAAFSASGGTIALGASNLAFWTKAIFGILVVAIQAVLAQVACSAIVASNTARDTTSTTCDLLLDIFSWESSFLATIACDKTCLSILTTCRAATWALSASPPSLTSSLKESELK
jgi:hypothetical protein